MNDVGVNIRRLRVKAGLTLVELAAATGLSRGTLQAISSGRTDARASTVAAIAAALKVDIPALFASPEPAGDCVGSGLALRHIVWREDRYCGTCRHCNRRGIEAYEGCAMPHPMRREGAYRRSGGHTP